MGSSHDGFRQRGAAGWEPAIVLPDADDDMVLELAFAAGCRYVVTHNVNDFRGSERLGVKAVTPRDFLNLIRKQP